MEASFVDFIFQTGSESGKNPVITNVVDLVFQAEASGGRIRWS